MTEKQTFDDLRKDLFFEVKKENVKVVFPNIPFGTQLQDVIYSPTLNGKVLGFTGSHYQLISNELLFTQVHEQMIARVGKNNFELNYSNVDDRQFRVEYIVKDFSKNINKNTKIGDEVCQMVIVENSYDGKTKVSFQCGLARLVCTNGLYTFSHHAKTTVKHHLDRQFLVNKSIEECLIYEQKQNDIKLIEELQDRKVSTEELEIFRKTLKELTGNNAFPKKLIDEVPAKMYQEASLLGEAPNAWLLYNSYNYYLNHDERIGLAMEVRERIDSNVLNIINKQFKISKN